MSKHNKTLPMSDTVNEPLSGSTAVRCTPNKEGFFAWQNKRAFELIEIFVGTEWEGKPLPPISKSMAKLVYVGLTIVASRLKNAGEFACDENSIAQAISCSTKTVSNALPYLEACETIQVIRTKATDSQKNNRNFYRLLSLRRTARRSEQATNDIPSKPGISCESSSARNKKKAHKGLSKERNCDWLARAMEAARPVAKVEEEKATSATTT
jgi:hypothetical protein